MRPYIALALVLVAACSASNDEPSTPSEVFACAWSGRCGEHEYALAELPAREWTGGLPVAGDGTLVVSTSLIRPSDWSTVKGHAVFTCDGCTLGDDRTPLLVSDPWGGDGRLSFDHLTFDQMNARADFDAGKMHLTVVMRSPDFDLDGRVDGNLSRIGGDTQLDGCVRFRPTAALRRRAPKTFALISVLGTPGEHDGWQYIAIQGTRAEMKRLTMLCEL